MSEFPADIFTEPSDVDPDTLANLGPLRCLAGTWEAKTGIDRSPLARIVAGDDAHPHPVRFEPVENPLRAQPRSPPL